jgi:type I restriction enzyme S subunit
MVPDRWTPSTLGAIALRESKRVDPSTEPECPYVALEHLASDMPSPLYYDVAGSCTSSCTRFVPSDILFGKLRPYLRKCAVVDRSGCCTGEILVIRTSDERVCLQEFLFHAIRHDDTFRWCDQLSFGTKMPRVDWKGLRDTENAVIPLLV